MKKVLSYIIALITLSVAVASCADDYFDKSQVGEGCINMTLLLNLPGSDTQTRSTTDATANEEKIESIHVLVFEGGKMQEEVTDIKEISNAGGKMMLGATTSNNYKSSIEVILLANLGKRVGAFNEYIGETKEEIYQKLVFDYTQWDISKQAIPMWGATIIMTPIIKNDLSVSLYRALGKVNINVKEEVDNFTLTSARVYYANDKGYSAPLEEPVDNEIMTPSIPADVAQFDKDNPLVYEIKDPTMVAIEDRIYIPETNNKTPGTGKKAVYIVVGGKYTGNGLVESGKESFYRIDLKDKESKSVYDVLRNHLYNFTINSVSSPGTPTPEDALESVVVSMDVTIEAWNETVLRSISDQYSLVTDKSRVSFDEKGETAEVVTVWSDFGENWTIVDVTGGWYELENTGGQIIITTKANYGASRTGSFYIQSGKLKKQIIVEQSQPGTANCYVVGGGKHQLSVIIKGNGTQGLHADGDGGSRVELDQTAVLNTKYVSVIWETKAGLITLINEGNGGSSQKAHPNEETGKLTYNIDIIGAFVDGKSGGNALIGAFDDQDQLIWSWHIWVCPDIASTGYKDEDWTLTGYQVMDRNLGAISNKPGVASLGLLYQWGRKDPFIGAATISTTAKRMETQNYFGFNWGVGGTESNKKTVAYTIKHPTQLIQDGLSVGEKGAYLWGTNGGLQVVTKELGTKTIYDPCPVGYRVPPVDAFVFKGTVDFVESGSVRDFGDNLEKYSRVVKWQEEFSTHPSGFPVSVGVCIWYEGQPEPEEPTTKPTYIEKGVKIKLGTVTSTYTLKKSSETKNWEENLVYIPYNLHGVPQGDWSMEDYLYAYPKTAITDATHYGYYINYQEVKKPKMKDPAKDYYTLSGDEKTVTWMPLSGAYDPEIGMTFDGVTIEQGSSLTVNSFIWTNSSIISDGTTRPGALFLHGANPISGKEGDGRHIHALIKSDIKAEPRYAGAVRCVRDTKKVFTADNKAPTTIVGESSENSVEGDIRAINDSWKVVDPGAPWFTISPDHAGPDKNRGTKICFKMKGNSTGAQRTATVKIKFSGEESPRTIEVTQK